MEEFQGILLSHRLRGVAPEKKGPFGMIKVLIYQIKMIILSFYPLMLNMAKRSRTTVEALELKGYQHSLKDPRVRKMKLARVTYSHHLSSFEVGASCSSDLTTTAFASYPRVPHGSFIFLAFMQIIFSFLLLGC